MKINDVMKQTYIQNVNNNKIAEVQTVNPVRKIQGQDQIELSNTSREIQKYVQVFKANGVDSNETVTRIKNQLANGTYDISAGKIAKGMIDKMK
ncbi:MAG: flagellar biosynthesis anti-sigma factor FlgM [Turicibacter sp.]